jgi:hypothetical protein
VTSAVIATRAIPCAITFAGITGSTVTGTAIAGTITAGAATARAAAVAFTGMVSETLVARGVAGGQAASTGTWPFGRQHTIGDDDQGLAIVCRDGL